MVASRTLGWGLLMMVLGSIDCSVFNKDRIHDQCRFCDYLDEDRALSSTPGSLRFSTSQNHQGSKLVLKKGNRAEAEAEYLRFCTKHCSSVDSSNDKSSIYITDVAAISEIIDFEEMRKIEEDVAKEEESSEVSPNALKVILRESKIDDDSDSSDESSEEEYEPIDLRKSAIGLPLISSFSEAYTGSSKSHPPGAPVSAHASSYSEVFIRPGSNAVSISSFSGAGSSDFNPNKSSSFSESHTLNPKSPPNGKPLSAHASSHSEVSSWPGSNAVSIYSFSSADALNPNKSSRVSSFSEASSDGASIASSHSEASIEPSLSSNSSDASSYSEVSVGPVSNAESISSFSSADALNPNKISSVSSFSEASKDGASIASSHSEASIEPSLSSNSSDASVGEVSFRSSPTAASESVAGLTSDLNPAVVSSGSNLNLPSSGYSSRLVKSPASSRSSTASNIGLPSISTNSEASTGFANVPVSASSYSEASIGSNSISASSHSDVSIGPASNYVLISTTEASNDSTPVLNPTESFTVSPYYSSDLELSSGFDHDSSYPFNHSEASSSSIALPSLTSYLKASSGLANETSSLSSYSEASSGSMTSDFSSSEHSKASNISPPSFSSSSKASKDNINSPSLTSYSKASSGFVNGPSSGSSYFQTSNSSNIVSGSTYAKAFTHSAYNYPKTSSGIKIRSSRPSVSSYSTASSQSAPASNDGPLSFLTVASNASITGSDPNTNFLEASSSNVANGSVSSYAKAYSYLNVSDSSNISFVLINESFPVSSLASATYSGIPIVSLPVSNYLQVPSVLDYDSVDISSSKENSKGSRFVSASNYSKALSLSTSESTATSRYSKEFDRSSAAFASALFKNPNGNVNLPEDVSKYSEPLRRPGSTYPGVSSGYNNNSASSSSKLSGTTLKSTHLKDFNSTSSIYSKSVSKLETATTQLEDIGTTNPRRDSVSSYPEASADDYSPTRGSSSNLSIPTSRYSATTDNSNINSASASSYPEVFIRHDTDSASIYGGGSSNSVVPVNNDPNSKSSSTSILPSSTISKASKEQPTNALSIVNSHISHTVAISTSTSVTNEFHAISNVNRFHTDSQWKGESHRVSRPNTQTVRTSDVLALSAKTDRKFKTDPVAYSSPHIGVSHAKVAASLVFKVKSETNVGESRITEPQAITRGFATVPSGLQIGPIVGGDSLAGTIRRGQPVIGHSSVTETGSSGSQTLGNAVSHVSTIKLETSVESLQHIANGISDSQAISGGFTVNSRSPMVGSQSRPITVSEFNADLLKGRNAGTNIGTSHVLVEGGLQQVAQTLSDSLTDGFANLKKAPTINTVTIGSQIKPSAVSESIGQSTIVTKTTSKLKTVSEVSSVTTVISGIEATAEVESDSVSQTSLDGVFKPASASSDSHVSFSSGAVIAKGSGTGGIAVTKSSAPSSYSASSSSSTSLEASSGSNTAVPVNNFVRNLSKPVTSSKGLTNIKISSSVPAPVSIKPSIGSGASLTVPAPVSVSSAPVDVDSESDLFGSVDSSLPSPSIAGTSIRFEDVPPSEYVEVNGRQGSRFSANRYPGSYDSKILSTSVNMPLSSYLSYSKNPMVISKTISPGVRFAGTGSIGISSLYSVFSGGSIVPTARYAGAFKDLFSKTSASTLGSTLRNAAVFRSEAPYMSRTIPTFPNLGSKEYVSSSDLISSYSNSSTRSATAIPNNTSIRTNLETFSNATIPVNNLSQHVSAYNTLNEMSAEPPPFTSASDFTKVSKNHSTSYNLVKPTGRHISASAVSYSKTGFPPVQKLAQASIITANSTANTSMFSESSSRSEVVIDLSNHKGFSTDSANSFENASSHAEVFIGSPSVPLHSEIQVATNSKGSVAVLAPNVPVSSIMGPQLSSNSKRPIEFTYNPFTLSSSTEPSTRSVTHFSSKYSNKSIGLELTPEHALNYSTGAIPPVSSNLGYKLFGYPVTSTAYKSSYSRTSNNVEATPLFGSSTRFNSSSSYQDVNTHPHSSTNNFGHADLSGKSIDVSSRPAKNQVETHLKNFKSTRVYTAAPSTADPFPSSPGLKLFGHPVNPIASSASPPHTSKDFKAVPDASLSH